MPKLPSDENIWSLPSSSSTEETNNASNSKMVDTKVACKLKDKNKAVSCWPPADWEPASGFQFERYNGHRTQAALQTLRNNPDLLEDNPEYVSLDPYPSFVSDVGITWDSKHVETNAMASLDLEALGFQTDFAFNQSNLSVSLPFSNLESSSGYGGHSSSSTKFNMRPQLNTGNPDNAQALQTGKLGELVAYKYYLGKAGDAVNWVNKDNETGLPYDIVVGEGGDDVEYIEVKTTRSARKDWFMITPREWHYAIEKGESFSVAHVVLLSDVTAKITTFKNPARLCQLGKLQLVVMMPKV